MFSFFKKDPIKDLEKQYAQLLEQGMQKQRGGDIKGYAEIMAQAETIAQKIQTLKNQKPA